MKARVSPTTAKDMLSGAQKKAVAVYVDELWSRKRSGIIRRFLLAACLALNDLYEFGDKRLMHTLNGIADILDDYASRSFTPSEARAGSIEDGDFDPMADAMQKELSSRPKIHIEIGDFIR